MGQCKYDAYRGFVVVAQNHDHARRLAAESDPEQNWLDSGASCDEVDLTAEQVVLDDYCEG
ncbi:MAG: hypothetical protein V3S71_06465 [Acidobacteriota bacterium]